MDLISLLILVVVALIILGVIFWAIRTLAPVLHIPEPIPTVIIVVLVLIVVLWFLSASGLLGRAGL